MVCGIARSDIDDDLEEPKLGGEREGKRKRVRKKMRLAGRLDWPDAP